MQIPGQHCGLRFMHLKKAHIDIEDIVLYHYIPFFLVWVWIFKNFLNIFKLTYPGLLSKWVHLP